MDDYSSSNIMGYRSTKPQIVIYDRWGIRCRNNHKSNWFTMVLVIWVYRLCRFL